MYHDYSMEKILENLRTSKHKKLILDTDTYNEIDDQFAVTYAMLAEDIDLLALTAAPFFNSRVKSVEEGMEKSYEEMVRVSRFVDKDGKMNIPCYRGSKGYLPTLITPVHSDAADAIIRIAHETDDIVYVACIGCYTNLASALLIDPTIADNVVAVLIGGNKFENVSANEFNLMQDRPAARIIFECGVPVVVLPAKDCTEFIYTTTGELAYYLKDKVGEIGNYLLEIFEKDEGKVEEADGTCNSRQRTIWDIGAISFMRDPDHNCGTEILPTMTIDAKGMWRPLNDDRNMIYVSYFHRNRVLSDFYTTVVKHCR